MELVAWPPELEFWVRRECYMDFAGYAGRAIRLRLEEPLHRQYPDIQFRNIKQNVHDIVI